MASFEYFSYADEGHLFFSQNFIRGISTGVTRSIGLLLFFILLRFLVAGYWSRFKSRIANKKAGTIVFRHHKSVISKEQIQDDCAICLEVFDNQREVVLARPCKHVFHLSCIEEWIEQNESCPVCRQIVNRLVVSYVVGESSTSADNLDSFGLEIV